MPMHLPFDGRLTLSQIRSLSDIALLRESHTLECKLASGRDGKGALPDDFWPTYSAMANTDGGVVLLGVRERKGQFELAGIEDPVKLRADLFNNLNNQQKVSVNLLTDADVQEHQVDGKTLMVVTIPRAARQHRPVHLSRNPLDGHTFRRLNEGDRHLPDEDVKRMLAEQVEDSRDARLLPRFGLQDLDVDSLKAYRNIFRADKPDHPWLALDDQAFLQMLGGWREDRTSGETGLTVAGLLMFGRWPSIAEALPNYFVDYQERPANYATTVQWLDRLVPDGTWSGNVFDFYRRVVIKLTADVKVPFVLKGDLRQDDTPTHRALREALVNALVHADFTGRVSVLVVKEPVGFSFRNPGALRVPAALALQGGVSDCRNRSMQQMFLMIGLGERAGSGMSRIVHGWKDLGHGLQLTERYEPQEQTELTMTWDAVKDTPTVPAEFGGVNDGVNGGVNPSLDPLDEQLLALIRHNPFLTLPELAVQTGKSPRTVERRVGKLKARHLRRVGSDKTGHWEVLEP